jgi:phosphoribosylanthranilate isomerase
MLSCTMHARTRVKICGITTPDDARAAADLGADAIGLNFYAKSPRFVTEEQARAILAVLPPFVEPVALFVNETIDTMRAVSRRLCLRVVQMHGDALPPVPCDELRYVPAFAVRDASSIAKIRDYLAACEAPPSAVLIDAHVPGAYGGTGQVAPWELLAHLDLGVPWMLAGGLTPDNVANAVRQTHPFAVDVASGVETRPGVKDTTKMRRFVEQVRSADAGWSQ